MLCSHANQDIPYGMNNCVNQSLHTALALGSYSFNQFRLKIELGNILGEKRPYLLIVLSILFIMVLILKFCFNFT